ncbi:hypothetical protein AVEN_14617-1 [Araneus ventricosus]|uniref:Uncharacterized protein n=1 Tax=Araneus ventricosus TaxID=182803 RepID=A0A4Y2RJ60_ARAVE|nr:hypothetical protein AVEN_14617-1 [Araneus ventricosus]
MNVKFSANRFRGILDHTLKCVFYAFGVVQGQRRNTCETLRGLKRMQAIWAMREQTNWQKDATQHGQPCSLTKLPKPHIKGLLRKSMLQEWQTSWKKGDKGRKIHNIMPLVSLLPPNWIREDVVFLVSTWPFPCLPQKVSPD